MSTLLGQVLLNRYRVDSFLGRGGMAEVYKVWDSHRNAWMAMKVLHEDLALDNIFLRRFKREAKTLEHLQHPNIVRFYGMEQEGRLIFMLMDYVDGESLKHKIFDANGALPFNEIYEITTQLAWALKYAHAEGFVHSDVKPANIMLDSSGQVQLSDFGITRMAESTTMTMVGAGTPAYMSPEQIRGEQPNAQTDIYALGIVLYEMLTGERPFTGELATGKGTTSEKVRWEQTNLQAVPPSRWNSEISSGLNTLVLKTLAKNKEERFQDIGAFLQMLSEVFIELLEKEKLIKNNVPVEKKKIASPKTHSFPFREKANKWSQKNKKTLLIILGSIPIFLFLGYLFGGLSSRKVSLPAQPSPTALGIFEHATTIAEETKVASISTTKEAEISVSQATFPTIPSPPPLTKTSDVPDTPEDFLVYYFDMVIFEKDFETGWGFLTDDYQIESKGFGNYIAFWKTVDKWSYTNINLEYIDSQRIRVHISFTLIYNTGQAPSVLNDIKYCLTKDKYDQTWKFDIAGSCN